MVCYAKSHEAGLNIGIAQAIWAINPFFVALMERFGYGVGLKTFQILGVAAMIACAVCISLSELFKSKDTSSVVEVKLTEITTSVHVAVLSSFYMPISCCFFAFIVKYADKNLRLSPYDFTSSYWFIMSLIVQISAVIYFVNNEGFFEW